MTIRKTSRSGGSATIVVRQKLNNKQELDILTIKKPSATQNFNVVVGFNEKDQLQIITKEENDEEKRKIIKDYTHLKPTNQEVISIDDILNCVNVENYPNCENTLVFYVTKNYSKEAIALRFENDQDFKRIYFTYKYFKMRNRLTKNTTNYSSSDNLFSKKKTYDIFKDRKKSIDDYNTHKDKSEFDLMQTIDNDGVTHISIHQKGLNSRFDQPMSLINIKHNMGDVDEIDSIIYTDIDIPAKADRKKLFHKKPKAPPPPVNKENTSKVLKGEFVRVNVDRVPDVVPRDHKMNKSPDILIFRDNKQKRSSPTNNVWSPNNKVTTGYESDREEWRNSRSQFSTTAFDSLSRPTKMAMALTLKKPQRLDPVPQYFRLHNDPKPKLTPLPFRPNYVQQQLQPRLPRATTEVKRNLNTDHRKFASLTNLEMTKKLNEVKKVNDPKKSNYSNLSHRITGITNKLRDLGNPTNTLGRFRAQSHSDVANLKPVLKSQDGSKRPVIRTCSAEPPKKVTFSAFATVQVV